MNETLISFAFNVLLGIIMYFLQAANTALQARITKTEEQVEVLKNITVKKDDFREFKDELWLRFDKMEVNFDRRLRERSNGHNGA